MASRRKPLNVPEKLVPQETKVQPIRDIEDIIKSDPTRSPYFSPIKTRKQRSSTAAGDVSSIKIKPSSSLVSQADLPDFIKNINLDKPQKKSAKVSRKTVETKSNTEHLKKVSEVEGPIEVLKPEPLTVEEPTIKKTVKAKKVAKESAKTIKIKSTKEEPSTSSSTAAAVKKEEELPPSPVKVTKRRTKSPPSSPESKLEKWEPTNWTQILDNIRIMRSSALAPVDTMGCDKCSDENADEKTRRFHVLLALMLSSQTKDEVTHEAMKRLTTGSNCTPQVIADMEAQKLETLLYPVSFYKNKAKYLKNTSRILVDQYDSDIPNDIKGLMKLPGIGPKMAHICMNSAWDIVTGIGVDVHVHRISNRLGWVRKETKQPEQTRKELESWLPSNYWKEVNHLLVGFGQTVCTPVKPKCTECLNKSICPAAFFVKPAKAKREKVIL